MSVKEILELDLDRLEVSTGKLWMKSELDNVFEVIEHLGAGITYRYSLKPLEPMKLTLRMLDDFNKGTHLSPYNGDKLKFLEKKYGRKIEIIGADKK